MLKSRFNSPLKEVAGIIRMKSKCLWLVGFLAISLSGITQNTGYTWTFGSTPPFVSTALSGATGSHTLTLLGDGASAIRVENDAIGQGTSCTAPINVGEYGFAPNYGLFGLQFNNNPQFITNTYTIEIVGKFQYSGNYHRLAGFYDLTTTAAQNATSNYGIYIAPGPDSRIIFRTGADEYIGESQHVISGGDFWYHIVFVRHDNKNIDVYLNGQLVETFADSDNNFLPQSTNGNVISFFKDEQDGLEESGGSIAKLSIYSSDLVNVTTLFNNICADIQAPSSFTLSSPGQTTNTIDLSWTAATDNIGVTGYDVYVGGVLNGNTTATTYTATGLTQSTQYSIYVKAKDAANNETNSNTITPTTTGGGGGTISGTTNYIAKFTAPSAIGNSILFDNGTSVGVGTININDANYKLFVETGIRTRKVKVDQVNWPDYVFDKKYKLPSLKEIEAFIKQHQHLPGIPSANEVEEKGLDLGANQAALLQKIEELTLHLIEMNKKVEKLFEENEMLKRRLEIKEN